MHDAVGVLPWMFGRVERVNRLPHPPQPAKGLKGSWRAEDSTGKPYTTLFGFFSSLISVVLAYSVIRFFLNRAGSAATGAQGTGALVVYAQCFQE